VTANGLSPIYFNHNVVNKGNATDNIIITANIISGGWDLEFIIDENNDGIYQETELTTFNSPLTLNYAASLNYFVKLTPTSLQSTTISVTVSTNSSPAVYYLGINNYYYGGSANITALDIIDGTDETGPMIIPIAPTADAQIVLPQNDLILEIIDDSSSININSIIIFINNEPVLTNGSFIAPYNGGNSQLIATANGYRVVVDRTSLLPQSTTISVTVNAADIYSNTITYNYQFKTTTASFVALQLRALLQGFYNPLTEQMVSTHATIELRNDRTTAAVSFNINLNSTGRSEAYEFGGIPAGDYYVYLNHYNHVSVITTEKITLGENVTTINISEIDSPHFREIYLSSAAQSAATAMRIENNGKLSVRGGDYNNDNTINLVDWSAFDYEWKNGGWIADYDGNGMIDTRDYGIWLSNNQAYLPIDNKDLEVLE
jgi:hypothetical protein